MPLDYGRIPYPTARQILKSAIENSEQELQLLVSSISHHEGCIADAKANQIKVQEYVDGLKRALAALSSEMKADAA